MNLYIKVEDGQTVEHPASEENLLHAFDGVIPSNWEPFVRVEVSTLSAYQVLDATEPSYQKVNGVWTDVWPVRDMTDEEKLAEQIRHKEGWPTRADYENVSTWTFDEETCSFVPPVPYPDGPMPGIKFVTYAEGIIEVEGTEHQRFFTYPENIPIETQQRYFWQGSTNSWRLLPSYPTDGQRYTWDFVSWSWKLIA